MALNFICLNAGRDNVARMPTISTTINTSNNVKAFFILSAGYIHICIFPSKVRLPELDAKRKLAEHVYGLRISSDTLVKDFVTEHDEITSQVDAVLIGAMVEKTKWGDGTAHVTVSLPGMEVWSVFHQQIQIISHR